jgi:predicted RecA/RadA family phage recombinase
MKAIFLQSGDDVIDYTPATAVNAGDVIVNNGFLAIALRSIAALTLGALAIEGIFKIQKKQEAFSAFDGAYWDEDGDPYNRTAGSGALTATANGNVYAGIVLVAAGATDETATVLLIKPKSITVNNPTTLAIVDPGNAGAIPVTDSGNVAIVTAGAETRTLAAPTKAGQQLSICMKTDGGDCVITCATLINQTGNNTITLNDAGDSLLLVAITMGANLRWRVAYNDGAVLSTV